MLSSGAFNFKIMEAGEEIITFETYYDPMLAQIVRTRLEDSDIPCFIADENLGTMYPLYNNAIGGIKLKIFARDLDKCKAILAEDNSANIDEFSQKEPDSQVNCPFCGSTDVKYTPAHEHESGLFTKLFSVLKSDGKPLHCNKCDKDFE